MHVYAALSGFVLGIIGTGSVVAAGFAFGQSAAPNAGLFSVSLTAWLLTHGIVTLVLAGTAAVRAFTLRTDVLGLVQGLLALWLALPWLNVGQTLLLRGSGVARTSYEHGWAIAALSLSYVIAALSAARTAWYLMYLRMQHKALEGKLATGNWDKGRQYGTLPDQGIKFV